MKKSKHKLPKKLKNFKALSIDEQKKVKGGINGKFSFGYGGRCRWCPDDNSDGSY